MSSLFLKRSLIFVTGSSRGFGKEIVQQFAKKFSESSCFVLISRSSEALKESCDTLKESFLLHEFTSYACDLSKTADVSALCENISKDFSGKLSQYKSALLVQNAGTLGQIEKSAVDLDDIGALQEYMCTNISSYILLNSAFLKLLKPVDYAELDRWIINISSICATVPMASQTEYASIKAAREMALRVLQIENPKVRTVSYSPGPLETDMSDELRSKWTQKEATKSWNYLTCEQSVNKLVAILEENKFEGACRIDYFDRN